jgi:hypothetical protein
VRAIFVVFGVPLMQPGDREFLGAYSSRSGAQRFVDAQPDDVRQNLLVAEIELDRHPPSGDFWVIPDE